MQYGVLLKIYTYMVAHLKPWFSLTLVSSHVLFEREKVIVWFNVSYKCWNKKLLMYVVFYMISIVTSEN